jgi:polyhydroxybutyrate depolymerase
VIRRTYDCPDEAAVEFLIVEGGGHSWPSSEFSRSIERIVGPTTFDIDASREVWDFLSRFRLPEP